jgi:hypothetical protein
VSFTFKELILKSRFFILVVPDKLCSVFVSGQIGSLLENKLEYCCTCSELGITNT